MCMRYWYVSQISYIYPAYPFQFYHPTFPYYTEELIMLIYRILQFIKQGIKLPISALKWSKIYNLNSCLLTAFRHQQGESKGSPWTFRCRHMRTYTNIMHGVNISTHV